MSKDEREQSHEELWKSQPEEPMHISTDEVCARARKYEGDQRRVYWGVLGVTALFVAGFAHNLTQFREPWLIAGTAWVFAICCYTAWRLARSGPARIAPAEACVDFLRRGFEAQRRALLWVRWVVVLLMPAILALWWGRGPVLGAQAWGVRSPRVLRLLAGPMPLIVLAVFLGFIYFAFSREAARVDREIQKLKNA